MALDLMRKRAVFGPRAGGPQGRDLFFVFPTNIQAAEAAINGFEIGFANGDHELLRTMIRVGDVLIELNTVMVRVIFSIRDASGDYDDPFDGYVDILVIVDRI